MYTITASMTLWGSPAGTISGDTEIAAGGTASVTFEKPMAQEWDTVTVSGASYSIVDRSSTIKVVNLSNPTSDVTIDVTLLGGGG